MPDPNDSKPKVKPPIVVDVDPVTLTTIIVALLLIPLLLSGFLFQ